MAASEEFESRLSAVERDVARLREETGLTGNDAAAARTLAAGADRDVSEVRAELRAHTSALNALRETQLETLRLIGAFETGLTGRIGAFGTGLGGRVDDVDRRLDELAASRGS